MPDALRPKSSRGSDGLLSFGVGIAERIEHLIALSGVSMRQFSLMCGLPPNSINVTLGRLRAPSDTDPGPSITVALLEKVARGAGCSFKWLALGVGTSSDAGEPFSDFDAD